MTAKWNADEIQLLVPGNWLVDTHNGMVRIGTDYCYRDGDCVMVFLRQELPLGAWVTDCGTTATAGRLTRPGGRLADLRPLLAGTGLFTVGAEIRSGVVDADRDLVAALFRLIFICVAADFWQAAMLRE